ncbi:MAG: NADH-quinone oxidoreductase subunit N [Fibromonadaceae bacterium]|jgi:NADH-quinone oxidoreductase subunit N|nr:NADH-quinone oxidoreductase subunit N [Fibromonadaceae bacterium]
MITETSFYHLKILLPLIVLCIGSVFALIAETFLNKDGKHQVLPCINMLFLAISAVFVRLISGAQLEDPWNLFSLNYVKEIFLYAIILCTVVGTAALQNTLKNRDVLCGEAYSLIMLSSVGIMLMVLSKDLMPLFLGMELASFPIYSLIAMNRNSKESNEAAFKYFISGAALSAVFLYGMALFYGATGSTLISDSVLEGRESIYQAAIFMLTFGLLFKVGAFPLHFWVADAYTGALAAVTGYMAAVVKIGAFLGLGAIWLGLFGRVVIEREAILFLCLGIASIVVGSITGLAQISARRILAFSAVANAGFILLGFSYSYFAKSQAWSLDLNSSYYFLLTYAIGSASALAGISALMPSSYDNLEDLHGAARKNPFLGACISISLASLAGLPVAAGFLAKFRIFAALVNASFETPAVWGIAIAAFILAVISATYYLRIIYFIWSHGRIEAKKRDKTSVLLNAGLGMAVVALLALAVRLPF